MPPSSYHPVSFSYFATPLLGASYTFSVGMLAHVHISLCVHLVECRLCLAVRVKCCKIYIGRFIEVRKSSQATKATSVFPETQDGALDTQLKGIFCHTRRPDMT